MHPNFELLQREIEPLRHQVVNHKVYSAIQSAEDLKIFMKYHIFAAWDFMSLLKSLQNHLTCTDVPWVPKGSAKTRFLINEIVCGEESDLDLDGNRRSHFELYLSAMTECGASTDSIKEFVQAIKHQNSIEEALLFANAPSNASDFVKHTFDMIHTESASLLAAVFTFGREDLIPNMFLSMINDFGTEWQSSFSTFKYYLERHIEVDGDHHSHLALEMTEELLSDDEQKWTEAIDAVKSALKMRIHLWNGVLEEIQMKSVLSV